MSKKYKNWDAKGQAAKQLIEQFVLFDNTNGAAGVNYNLNKPKDLLNEVYNTCSFLECYNPSYFANNFRNLRNNYLLEKKKSESRKKKNSDSGTYLFSYLFLRVFESISYLLIFHSNFF